MSVVCAGTPSVVLLEREKMKKFEVDVLTHSAFHFRVEAESELEAELSALRFVESAKLAPVTISLKIDKIVEIK